MNDQRKPACVLELDMVTDATPEAVFKAITEAAQLSNWFPPEASSEGTGVGSSMTVSWGEAMSFTTKIGAWEPGRHVQWVSDDMMGPGTSLVTDWHIATEAGKTRLRMVQSGFGAFDGWDDFFAGTETGWRFFLYNLRMYLEKHAGKVRRMISHRSPVGIARADAWKKMFAPGVGLAAATGGPARVGERVKVDLGERAPLDAVVELAIPERLVALRIPSLDDALLMLEFEGCAEGFSLGSWLSVYDPAAATRIEAPAQRAFDRFAAAVK